MDKIGEICHRRKLSHQKLLSMDSTVYRAFLDMEMGGGRATVSARFALAVMDKVFGEASPR